jgi:hypothetical protein
MTQAQEFGHSFANIAGAHIDTWFAGPFVIKDVFGKRYRFEDSDRFGPVVISKRGEALARQPGQHSPFWHAWEFWKKQGRGVDGERCIYEGAET